MKGVHHTASSWTSYIETILERHTQKRIGVKVMMKKVLGSIEYELRIISKKKKRKKK